MICGDSHALLRIYEMIVLIFFKVLGQALILLFIDSCPT
ncbi:hypothetical protein LEP1GSC191_0660 [Leptospira borgpetersenii serovar Mini str. 201000851]|uniref:Lipoprotein n=1 Tax=Leptospira borgpetersenii str. 200801926 TaxID=1193009 RepID=A0ABN0I2N1_LEPBO|nr:hypothetical protein LEP1GSC128_2150 [Leptospira borgpetersenii str. 200801926]EMK11489.1 hypothetical protein LEP1GSC066_1752 [Leptospira sp. serovar Kenya str. Sh9]ENO64700.1 hypothetical protein LEP1GSC191_0660 [Leptospira borgpetersenii serovar Mini str. 201000851]